MTAGVYHNEPGDVSNQTSHLFRGGDLLAAGVADGETDEPVTSVCGTVRAYGPFEEGVPEEACGNCKRKLNTDDD